MEDFLIMCHTVLRLSLFTKLSGSVVLIILFSSLSQVHFSKRTSILSKLCMGTQQSVGKSLTSLAPLNVTVMHHLFVTTAPTTTLRGNSRDWPCSLSPISCCNSSHPALCPLSPAATAITTLFVPDLLLQQQSPCSLSPVSCCNNSHPALCPRSPAATAIILLFVPYLLLQQQSPCSLSPVSCCNISRPALCLLLQQQSPCSLSPVSCCNRNHPAPCPLSPTATAVPPLFVPCLLLQWQSPITLLFVPCLLLQ